MEQQKFVTTVSVVSPEKVGDGISAYVAYTVRVTTNNPKYGISEFQCARRFREFHALYETLVDVYRQKGIMIPHPPEKSVSSTALIKLDMHISSEPIRAEKRRTQLERFINRITSHPVLQEDQNVIEFLTKPVTSVKPRDGLLKFKSNIEQVFSNRIPDMETYDEWFEKKVETLEQLQNSLNETHLCAMQLVAARKDLIDSTEQFIGSFEQLINGETNTTITKAYEAIIELKRKAIDIYQALTMNDVSNLVCTVKDFLDDMISAHHLLEMYKKKFNELKGLENSAQKQRDKLNQLKAAGETPDLIGMSKEVEQLELKLKHTHTEFNTFCDTLRKEMDGFDEHRVKHMHTSLLSYMKTYHKAQAEILSLWKTALPVCQAIS